MTKQSNTFNEPLNDVERAELEAFKNEKDRIRHIVGEIGGKPTIKKKLLDRLMLAFIILTLVSAPFLPHHWELPAIEGGLALLSLKIFFLLQNEQRVNHFQFWMLSSLEWRLNDMSKRIIRIEKEIQKITSTKEGEKPE